jgi:CTP synthase
MGIQPDLILARADYPIKKEHLKKIALFCDVDEKCVIPAPTVNSIYEVPLNLQKYKITQLIADKLKLKKRDPNLTEWKKVVRMIKAKKTTLKIAMVGKYTGLEDAYISVIESLKIACYHQKRDLKVLWIDSEKLEKKDKKTWRELRSVEGIVVPGGFGIRGTEGKIMAAKYARENKKPYLGLCLGMQIMSIEFAQHILKDPEITSEEFDEEEQISSEKYIIHFLPGQHKNRAKGGTLRLGAYKCKINKKSKTYKLYGKTMISERHRHRYEFNNSFKESLEKAGMIFPGINPESGLVEIAELSSHPFMIGCQFHPEFKSRPNKPHPLFKGFIEAAKN